MGQIVKGEITISKQMKINGAYDVFIDLKILDHKLNSHIARYDIEHLPDMFGLLIDIITEYVNDEVKELKWTGKEG